MLVLTTVSFSQQYASQPNSCLTVTSAVFSLSTTTLKPTYNLTIIYDNPSGQKSILTTIFCNNAKITPLEPACVTTSLNSGTITYTGLVCDGGIQYLSASFERFTGNSCGGTACGTTQTLPPNNGPLPIKLSGFSAVRSKQVVSLNWNTEFEIEAKEFIVERAEGSEFRSIATIRSNSNSSSQKSY